MLHVKEAIKERLRMQITAGMAYPYYKHTLMQFVYSQLEGGGGKICTPLI